MLSTVLPKTPLDNNTRSSRRKHPRDVVGPQSLAKDPSELPPKRARVLDGVDEENRLEDDLPEQVCFGLCVHLLRSGLIPIPPGHGLIPACGRGTVI